MQTMIALLRGINVGGHRKIKMADLRKHLEVAGFQQVQTYIQSGNIVFQSGDSAPALEVRIKELILEKWGFEVEVMVLSGEEWAEIERNNPFLPEQEANIARLSVTVLGEVPAPKLLPAVPPEKYLPDQFQLIGRAVYLYLPNGMARTKLQHGLFEKKWATRATNRNWKTVRKLLAMSQEA